MDRESHWNNVYATKRADSVSWYQRSPERSIDLIRKFTETTARVIDVGAGASLLVDALLDAGYLYPIVLDVSAAGLECAKARLGELAARVQWVVADVTQNPTLPAVDLWHDRAALHFLTDAVDQESYAKLAARTVRPGGHLVIATFAPDGPERCSGLQVRRHDAKSLLSLFDGEFEHVQQEREVHITPAGAEQVFSWSVLRRRSGELRRPRRSSIPAPMSSPTDHESRVTSA
jgi:SAM-dependent methyltransferase